VLGLWSPSLDSTLRASLRLSKIAPGDFVAMLTPTYRAAIQREKQIKKWNRAWKLQLIESKNPEWRDLYLE
jgi:hypothetical protein